MTATNKTPKDSLGQANSESGLRQRVRDAIGLKDPHYVESVGVLGVNLPADRFETILDSVLAILHQQLEAKTTATPSVDSGELRQLLQAFRLGDDSPLNDDEELRLQQLIDAHTQSKVEEAEYRGRHAEVVKALFLLESLGDDYDVKKWLRERLADLKASNKQSEAK